MLKNLIILAGILISYSVLAETNTYILKTHNHHINDKIINESKIIKSTSRLHVFELSVEKAKKYKAYIQQINPKDVYNYKVSKRINFAKNPEVERLISDVNVNEMKMYVSKLSQFKKRSAGTTDNNDAANYIYNELKGFGLETHKDCFRVNTCNVFGLLKSKSNSEYIIIEAHLDSVGRAYAGADDNASGIAGLLMIAKRISKIEPNKSIIFFATNAEENGLVGAYDYVRKLKRSGKLSKIKFVLNMDMIGYNKKSNLVDIETNAAYKNEAEWMSQLAYQYTSLEPNISIPAWGSDHVPFLEKNIPSILTIEHWPTKTPCYHSSCDKPDHLTYEYGIEIIKLNIATTYLKAI
jgi:Zn-dependent M28 family amino/carboxypeptidase